MKKKGKTVKRSGIELPAKSKVKPVKSKPSQAPDVYDQSIHEVELSLLIPTPDNKRPINEKAADFVELFDSVKLYGVKVPVIARPHPEKKGYYDLRAGARRRRAAQLAGRKTIPVIVRQMTDIEAADITFIENWGRKDLTPMERAEQLAGLLETHDGDYQAVADTVGKPVSWVHRVVNVHANLSAAWRKAIGAADTIFGYWTIGHYELIARLDQAAQDKLLSEIAGDCYGVQCEISIAELKKDLEAELRVLDKAPWGMEESLKCADDCQPCSLVEAKGGQCRDGIMPTCKACTKRSGSRPMLFEDVGKKDKHDMCLDPLCWDRKQLSKTHKTIAAQKAKLPKLVVAAESWSVDTAAKRFGEVQSLSNYQPCKKGDAKAIPVLKVNGDTVGGNVVWMKANGRSEPQGKASGAKTMADKQKELTSKRWNSILKTLRKMLDATVLDKITPSDKITALLILVSEYSTSTTSYVLKMTTQEALELKHFNTSEQWNDVLEAVWEMVRDNIDSEMAYNGPITQVPEVKIETGKFVAWLIGADLAQLEQDAAVEFPVPRSWGKIKDPTTINETDPATDTPEDPESKDEA